MIGNVVVLPGLSELSWKRNPDFEGRDESESGGSFDGVWETGTEGADGPPQQRPGAPNAAREVVNQRRGAGGRDIKKCRLYQAKRGALCSGRSLCGRRRSPSVLQGSCDLSPRGRIHFALSVRHSR